MDKDWRQRVEETLANKKLSLRGVSVEAGMGPHYLSQILRQAKAPSIDNLTHICNIIGVQLSYILTGVSLPSEITNNSNSIKDIEKLASDFITLPEHEQELILQLADSLSKTKNN